MRPQHFLLTVTFAVVALALYGCAKLQDNPPAPVAPGLTVHPPGWSDSTSANFHGKAIQADGYDMRPCKTCHGQTYTGGAVNVSCRTCHTKAAGPENCTTCHGGVNNAPPKDLNGNTSPSARGVGAHQVHLVGPRKIASVQIPCTDCHTVPGSVYDPGHLDSPPPAKVQITSALARTVTGGVTPVPSYDPATGRCSNTYCHGAFTLPRGGSYASIGFADTATVMVASNYAPVWNGGGNEAQCGTCHGDLSTGRLTPLGHRPGPQTGNNALYQRTDCVGCHAGVVDASGNIADPSKHMNGKINVFGQEYNFR